MNNLKVGQFVKVVDKRPRPPKHHTKKLKDWLSNHFNGEVMEVRENEALVKNLDASNEVITYTFWIYKNDNRLIVAD